MADLQNLADESEILRIRRLWAFSRDEGDWETVKTLFHPDAMVAISWYTGTALGFVEASKKMFGNAKPGIRSKHWFGNYRLSLHKTRALLETDIEVRGRDFVGEYLFDFLYEGRFFDRFEKRDGVWKIAQWTCVYDRDRLDPVIPGSVPASFFEGVKFDGLDAPIAFMQFRQRKTGRPAVPVIIGGTDAETKLKSDAHAWLKKA
jgi:hypothetical protein